VLFFCRDESSADIEVNRLSNSVRVAPALDAFGTSVRDSFEFEGNVACGELVCVSGGDGFAESTDLGNSELGSSDGGRGICCEHPSTEGAGLPGGGTGGLQLIS
jgi:hypothetical protein